MAGSSIFLLGRVLIVAMSVVLVAQAPAFGQDAPEPPSQRPEDTPAQDAFHAEVSDELQKRSPDLGPDFAGAWIDKSDRGRILLGFKGKAGADRAKGNPALSKLANDPRVTFVETKFSQRELYRAIDRAAAKVEELLVDPASGVWPFYVADKQPENAVDVVIDQSVSDRRQDVEQALQDDIESGLVRVIVGKAMMRDRANVCVSRHGCNPMRGGLGINGALCTSGFVFRNDAGTRFMSTASHCGFASMTHNGQALGPRVWQPTGVEVGRVDAAIYDINNPNQAQPNNSIYVSPDGSNATDTRVPSKVGVPDSSVIGDDVCNHAKSGVQGNCSEVTALNVNAQGVCCLGYAEDLFGCDGDSGGPIAGNGNNKAYGLLKSVSGDTDCAVGTTWSWVAQIESISNYTLIIHRATKRLKGNQGLRGRYDDQRIDSSAFTYTARMQSDGNFVLYLNGGGSIWSSGTAGNTNGFLVMQGDGNLVIKNASGVVQCATGTHNNPGAYLEIGEDAKLRIKTAGGSTLWTNGSCS